MPRQKQTNIQRLQNLLRRAKKDKDVVLESELQQVLIALQQPRPKALRALAKLLTSSTNHVTKHYIAGVLGSAQEPTVIKSLIRAAKATENQGYTAPYFWACTHYDCTEHINFFVQFLLKSQDPGEAAVACVNVIEEMKGPFDAKSIKRNISRLLQRNPKRVEADLQLQDEVFTIQAAYALLDKYFDQIDKEWKREN